MVNLKLKIPDYFFEEEIRDGHRVSREQKELWAVELDLLAELLRVCRENDLNIYADGGTMLGAVRQRGFIPWDDDIDMTMMREDYEKLCAIAPKNFKDPYFFQTEYTDPGSLRGHAQLRNSQTTGILPGDLQQRQTFNQGIFVDIFPLDAAPDDPEALQKIQSRTTDLIIRARRRAELTTRYKPAQTAWKKLPKWVLHKLMSSPFGTLSGYSTSYDMYEQECQKYNRTETKCVAKYYSTIAARKSRQVWKRQNFSHVTNISFEFLELPVPDGYEEILNRFFGDWHTPSMSGAAHTGIIFDTSISYRQYYAEHQGVAQ